MADEDDPATRAYPVSLTILQGMHDCLDVDHAEYGSMEAHIIDLTIVGFYWLLRPAEYLKSSTPEARSQAFQLQHAHFTINGQMYAGHAAPLNDATIASSLSYASLEFADQKNAVRGERVGLSLIHI